MLLSLAVMAVVLCALYSANGLVRDGFDFMGVFTPVDWAWRSVWDSIGWHKIPLPRRASQSGSFWLVQPKRQEMPARLTVAHHLIIDATFMVPAFASALFCYHLLTKRYLWPRCRHCGTLLHALARPVCPTCGGSL